MSSSVDDEEGASGSSSASLIQSAIPVKTTVTGIKEMNSFEKNVNIEKIDEKSSKEPLEISPTQSQIEATESDELIRTDQYTET
jgi:hypothetical protein